MSVVLVVIIVMLMLNVPTLLEASPVPVTKDTVEMGLTVQVSYLSKFIHKHGILTISSGITIIDIDEW